MKRILLLTAIALTFSCKNDLKEKKEIEENKKETVSKNEDSKIGRQNYAVVWKWATTNKQLIEDNIVTISSETNNLWKEDVITDAYYNADAKIDKLEYFPNISFFVKSKSYEEAETILNKLLIVKKRNCNIYLISCRY